MPTLTSAARRALRANAHTLHPVVAIGQHGLTPAVLHEIDGALKAHELIKVRVFDDDRDAREAMLARVCAELECAAVQHIGKLLVVWRPNPPAPAAAAKKPHKSAATTSAKPAAGARRRSDNRTKTPAAAPRETGANTRRRRAAAAALPPAPTGRRQRSRTGDGAPAAPATRGVPSRRRRRIVKS